MPDSKELLVPEQSPGFPIAPWKTPLLDQAKAYCKATGLPRGAIVSVCQAVNAMRQLSEECTRQWGLPWGERQPLIQSPAPLNEWQVEQVTKLAQDFGVPVDACWGALSRGQFLKGITASGWRLRAQSDPRILKHVATETIERGMWGQPPVPYICVRATVSFWTGETYQGIAMADGNSKQAVGENLDRIASIAETRALNRALKQALRMPLILSDEDEGQAVDVEDAPETASVAPFLITTGSQQTLGGIGGQSPPSREAGEDTKATFYRLLQERGWCVVKLAMIAGAPDALIVVNEQVQTPAECAGLDRLTLAEYEQMG